MNYSGFLQSYWPILAFALWFLYKKWTARNVRAMLPALKRNGAMLVDVRSPAEFVRGNAPGTINIPLPELASRLSEIPKSAPVVLCCASGTRSGMARMVLKKHGYPQVYNAGTWSTLLD